MKSHLLVEPLEGGTVYIKCRPNTTIEDVKAQVEIEKGIPIDRQRLFFNAAEFMKPNQIIRNCTKEIVTLQLLESTEQYVAVRESCGKAKLLKFYSDDTPLDILEKVEMSSIHSKCLMFQGRELDCGSSLTAQNILSGDTIHVVIKHRRQVYVRTFNGGISVPCSPLDTVRKLKVSIQMKEGIPSEHQQLLKCGTALKDSDEVPLRYIPQLVVKDGYLCVVTCRNRSYKDINIVLKYDPSETVWSVKQKLHRRIGIPPELQELTFNKRVLDDGHQLVYYKLKNHDKLGVKERYSGPLTVELITGGAVRIFITPQDTVASVKEKLQEKCDIAQEKQRLFLKGRELTVELQRMCELEYFKSYTKLLLVRQGSDIFYVEIKFLSKISVLCHNPRDTVRDIKLKLQETNLKLDLCKMKLLFDGKTLEESQELSNCGICKESTVVLDIVYAISKYDKNDFKVFHKGSVCSIELQFHSRESVRNIKALIQKQLDVDLHDHDIVGTFCIPLYDGTSFTTLEDSKTLTDYASFRKPLYCVPKPWPQVLVNVKNGLTGKTVTVEACPFHTIADLKGKIEDREGFKIDQQHLLLTDQELENKLTLDDCNILDGCTLFLIPDSHKRCQVSVRISSSKETLSLIAEPTTTVEMIKAEVEYLGGIPKEWCALSIGKNLLKNELNVGEVLKDYRYSSTLHLVAKRVTRHNVASVGCLKLLDPVPICGPFLIPVYVCQHNKQALVMEVYPTTTVEEFKVALHCRVSQTIPHNNEFQLALHHRDSKSIPPDEMQLTFSDKILEPCNKLMDYSITRGSVMHIKSVQNRWYCIDWDEEDEVLCERILFIDSTREPSILPYSPSRVPLLVQIPGRSVTPIVCSPNTTVGDVKNKVAQKEGIPIKHQHLVFSGRLLENERTLSHYSVHRENTIHVILTGVGTTHLLVQTHEGESVNLECDITDTIGHVKATLNAKLRKRTDLQSLFFANKMLENDKTLQAYNIQSNLCTTLLLKPNHWFSVLVKSSSKQMTLEVQPNDSIREVKKKIQCIEGIPTNEQSLFFGGDRLEDTQTVRDIGVSPWDIVALQRPTDIPVIFVKSTTNELLSVTYVESMSVLEIKTHIYTTRRIPPEQQSLFFKGSLLENKQTLGDSEIHQWNTLHLIVHLCDTHPLSIETFNGTTTSLNVAPIHTVGNIKVMLWHRLGIPPDQQCLYLRSDPGSKLDDDCLVNSHPRDCMLCLAQRPKAVFIRRNSGPSIKLDWPSHSNITTSEIQSALQEKEGIQAEKMTLALGPTILRDEQCLCSYSILNQMRKESYCLQLAEDHSIFVVCPTTGETVLVEYSSYDDIGSIYAKINAVLGEDHVATQNHYLLVTDDGKLFYDVGDKTLKKLTMTKTTTLYLIPPDMVIFVTTRTGLWMFLEVSPLDTTSMLKVKIQRHWGFPVAQQQLIFKEEHLVDEKSLFNYNIQDESTLHLELLPWKQDQISIEMPAKTITLEVNPLETIESIKSRIEQREGIPASHQHIYLTDYSELEDEEKTLSGFSVKSHTTLRLLARPKQILLLTGSGKIVQVKWQKWYLATVMDLKVALQIQEGIPADRQQIFLDGDSLEDDHSLVAYNVLSHVLEHDYHFLLATEPIMLIREYGTTLYTSLDYHPDHTIAIVREKIGEKGIYRGKFHLVEPINGHLLKDDDRLLSCNISAGGVLDLVPDKPVTVLILFPSGETVNMTVNVLDDEHVVMSRVRDEWDPFPVLRHPYFITVHTGERVKRLYDSTIVEGSILLLKWVDMWPSIGTSFSSISLHIVSTGKTFEIKVGHDELVKSVKLRIERTEGTPSCLQRISLEGQELDDDETLSHYSIKDGAILKVEVTGHLLTIKMHMGKAIHFLYNADDSIAEIKKVVQEKERIPPANQMFVFNGKELQDDHQVLKDCNVGPNSTLHLLRKHRMQIRVVTHVGEGGSVQLPVQPGDTIEHIKQLIQVFKQLPATQQRIFHQGCELNDWMTLSDFCIQPGSTVYLVPQQLHIWISENASIALRYDENDSVASVKIAIQEKEGIPAEKQDLLFGELKLEDYHTLKECGIRNEYFLYLQLIEGKRYTTYRQK